MNLDKLIGKKITSVSTMMYVGDEFIHSITLGLEDKTVLHISSSIESDSDYDDPDEEYAVLDLELGNE